jgi:serine/threonine protein kinase
MSETLCPRCGGVHHPNTGSCPEFPLAGTLPDGLRVLQRLSETRLGVLYRAEYLDSHDEVELVVLRPEGTGSEPTAEAPGLVHLRDQLHRAARVKHPNVASVRAMGETEDGAHWAAFEVFRGKLLSEILSAPDLLPPNEAIDVVLQAATGLQATHEVGLVHGNLSPETILVTRTADDRPLVKLIRFGLVQHGAEPSVAGGESSRYAAPEELAGHSPDERSDVFSLGAVLYHLLTGSPPSAQRSEPPGISDAVRRILAKALEPLPDHRFQTVAAFARALAGTTTRPPERIQRGAQRAGRLAGVLAIVVVVAIAALWRLQSGERPKLVDAPGGAIEMGEPTTTGEVREPQSRPLDSIPMLFTEPGSDSAADLPPVAPRRPPATRPAPRGPSERTPMMPESVVAPPAELKVAEPERRGLEVVDTEPDLLTRREPPRAPTPPPQAVVPPVLRPAPSGPEPRAVTRTTAEAEARAAAARAIAAYARALESNDLQAVLWAYPELTERERASWKKFFSATRDLVVNLNIDRFAMVDSEAHVDVRGTYRYWNRSLHRAERSPVRFLATLRRSTDGWRLTDIR